MGTWDNITYHWWKIRIFLILIIVIALGYLVFQWVEDRGNSRFDNWPRVEATIQESILLETAVSDEYSVREKLLANLQIRYDVGERWYDGSLVVPNISREEFENRLSEGKTVRVRHDPAEPERVAFFWDDQSGPTPKGSGGSLP